MKTEIENKFTPKRFHLKIGLLLSILISVGWLVHVYAESFEQRTEKPGNLMAASNPPVGTIMAWAGPVTTIPREWILCDGRALDRTKSENKALFEAIGTSWGGDATTFYNVPDLSGRFLRGVDKYVDVEHGNTLIETNPARDPDRGTRLVSRPGGHLGNDVGSIQGDIFQSHKHDLSVSEAQDLYQTEAEHVDCGDSCWVNGNEGNHDRFRIGVSMGGALPYPEGAEAPRVGLETRPRNASVFWIIRAR
jgi:hypothetical protein